MKKIIFLFASLFILNSIHAQTTLEEGFESWPPDGWQVLELGNALDGWRDDFNGNAHTGDGSAYSSIDNSQSDNWLITPSIEVTSNNYELKFWDYHTGIEFYDKASVLISTGSGDPTDGGFVEIYTTPTPLNSQIWEERTIDLSSYNGENIYIGFRHEGTWHSWNLDDVTVSPDTYTDGALIEFLSPTGVSEIPIISPVIITLENLGTSVINNFIITWEVNSISQTSYNGSGLNLQPGQSSNIDIGNYNFDIIGSYSIEATLDLANDFDSSNNVIVTVFDVASEKDGAIIGITPEGMIPNVGNIDVNVIVTNLGINTIDVAEVLWSIDGIIQTPFAANSLNLVPGETRSITIGQGVFISGIYNVNTTLNVLGDINEENDNYQGIVAVNTFWESFEGTVWPPEGWSIDFGTRDDSNFGNAADGEYYYVASADDNYFGVISDTIYTPLLDIENGDTFSFYIKTSPFLPADHSLVWKDGVTGEVHHIQNITNTNGEQWELRNLNISSAEGVNYIGISTNSTGGYGESRFDLFTSTANLYIDDQDLKILEGDMYFMAKQNVSESFECKIKNGGALPVLGTNYTVKLMEAPDTELASVSGVDLDFWEETIISVPRTFTDISEKRLFFKIDFSGDENISNNQFRESSVSVVPSTVEITTIGSEDFPDANFPFTPNGNTNTLGEDDMSQLLYYNDEFNSPGLAYGMAYKYDNLLAADKVIHYPLQVWISQTNLDNLSGGYIPSEDLVLVFDGVVEILPGNNRDLYIPFNQPVLLNGIDNVVVKNYQYDPEWPPSILRWKTTSVPDGPIRTIGSNDVYDLDPNDPPGFFTMQNFSFSRFVIDPQTSNSVLSGVVYDNTNNNPLVNATVSVENTSIATQTNANGEYVLPEIPYGTYNIIVSNSGYLNSILEIELNTSTQTQDFYLDPLPELEVFGSIVGSNNLTEPLEFVAVSVSSNGNIIETTTTDANGEFVFPLIYGGSDYEVSLFLYGYFETTVTITAINTNIDLGEIILEQEFICPFDVEAIYDTDATVNWKSPKESDKVKLQNDLGVISNSYTNEPNEAVWLGNIFEITEMTTITSIEINTDVYQNATDYVSIDIFDLNTNEILASSELFLIQKDSVQTINVPNIVVSNNISAMIHWQNNPESTNALVIDYSDPNITNSAAIKYPGESILLLSDYFGNGAPNMSFHLRVNILDDGTPITNTESLTYNVYRGLASEFPNTSAWDQLNTSPISDISMIDEDAANLDPNVFYRYAVETIYTDGVSEVTFSNELLLGTLNTTDNEFLNSKIQVYPVPSNKSVTINLGSNLSTKNPIEAYDSLGRQVLMINPSELDNGVVTKNISFLQSGVYFFKINIEGVIINKKFIVN
tara:strand:+ start:1039 stop:5121 length:4083 start_codon:yes stop_codon:yes gene_type:complete